MLHKLIVGVAGVYLAYLTMSYLSEDLYNSKFAHRDYDPKHPDDPHTQPSSFKHPSLMVALGCLLCSVAGFTISVVRNQPKNPISIREQALMGGLFAVNMVTTNSALLYISYPVQVIGRNVRFLCVVVTGAFFSRLKDKHKHLKLGRHKIFIAAIITVGVLLFNFAKGKSDRGDRHDPSEEWIGYVLLTISVVVDALFSDSQAYSKATFRPSANQLFTVTNFYCLVFCGLYSLLVEQSLASGLSFMWNYPGALTHIVGIGLLQVLGQISVYYIVANFKQHIFPLIATTRKILTVILSIFVFDHSVNKYQWVAIVIVFGGMFYELYEEVRKDQSRSQIKEEEGEERRLKDEEEGRLNEERQAAETSGRDKTQ